MAVTKGFVLLSGSGFPLGYLGDQAMLVVLAIVLQVLGGTIFCLLMGTLGEYLTHRFMHTNPFVWADHAGHHRDGPGPGTGQGWVGEVKEYSYVMVPILLILEAIAWWTLAMPAVSVGMVIGGFLWVALSAYCHQAQHDRPELMVWLKMPSHHIHHVYNQWHYNFGVTVDWWDRVFGTYKEMPWQKPATPPRFRDFLNIRWRRGDVVNNRLG
jgi:sterol desaturase/sphingolipid hydroxylase (fatty acid hydroxylase superfamily)